MRLSESGPGTMRRGNITGDPPALYGATWERVRLRAGAIASPNARQSSFISRCKFFQANTRTIAVFGNENYSGILQYGLQMVDC